MGSVGGGAPGSKKGGMVVKEADDTKTMMRTMSVDDEGGKK